MQPPIRLQPLLSNCAARNVSKITSGSKLKTAFLESEAPFPIGVNVVFFKKCISLNCRLKSCAVKACKVLQEAHPVHPWST